MLLATRLIQAAGGGGDSNIPVGAESILFTGYDLSIPGISQNIDIGTESVVYTEYAPTLTGVSTVVPVGLESILYTGQNLTINDGAPQDIAIGVESILYTEYAPTVLNDVDIPIGVEAVRYTEYAPTVSIPNADLTISYVGNSTNTSTQSTYTFTSESLGALPGAGEQRWIIVGVSGWSEDIFTTPAISSVTVAGSSASIVTKNEDATSDTFTALCLIEDNTNTSGNIVVTTDGDTDACGICVYRVIAKDNQDFTLNANRHAANGSSSIGSDSLTFRPGFSGSAYVALATHDFTETGNTTWTMDAASFGTEAFDDLVSGHWSSIYGVTDFSTNETLDIESSHPTSGDFTSAVLILERG